MKKKSRVIIAMLLVCIMLTGLLAGCGSGSGTPSGSATPSSSGTPSADKDAPTASASAAGNSEASPQGDGTSKLLDTLGVGSTTLWETLTPFRNISAQFSTFVRHMYDRLAFRTADGQFIPQAAKSWKVTDDGLTYSIELYDYITDSAGNHITASDVVWILEENMSRGTKPCFNKIDHVEQTGDYTFNIVMKQDMVHMLEMILYSTYIFSKQAFEASPDEFATTLVSTSPYQVTDYVAGSHITFTRRDNYWQKEDQIDPRLANNVKVVTYRYITEASQQQIALESGTIDVMETMAATSVQNFEGNNAYGIMKGPSSNGIQIYFSGADSSVLANDVDLRKAICYALDINGIIKAAYSGNAEPMHDVVPRTNVGYLPKWDNEEYFGYNVDLAKDHLQKSGYNGETLSLLALSSAQRLSQMIQSYLSAIGIKLELNVVDAAQWSASMYDGNNYDILIAPVGNGLVNLWSNRFDGTSYANGDATSRKDQTLTDMLYSTWTNTGFTEKNIDAVHQYIIDNCYAYGVVLPLSTTVYSMELPVADLIITDAGAVDMVATTYK